MCAKMHFNEPVAIGVVRARFLRPGPVRTGHVPAGHVLHTDFIKISAENVPETRRITNQAGESGRRRRGASLRMHVPTAVPLKLFMFLSVTRRKRVANFKRGTRKQNWLFHSWIKRDSSGQYPTNKSSTEELTRSILTTKPRIISFPLYRVFGKHSKIHFF